MGGEFRNFAECFPTWTSDFLSQFDYDIFLSTWSITNVFSDLDTHYQELNRKEDVTEDNILNIIGKKPRFLNIEEPINFEHRGNGRIYHWQRLLTTLNRYKSEYDYAIITRPDVILNKFALAKFINECDKSIIYSTSRIFITDPPTETIACADDWFFMSNPKKLIDVLLPIPFMKIADPYLISAGRGEHSHRHLAEYFIMNNHYIHGIDEIVQHRTYPDHIIVNSYDKERNRDTGHPGWRDKVKK